MSRDRFLFFANFKEMAKKMSPDMRLKFYDAITDYVFDGVEPKDEMTSILLTAIKPSLDKEDARGGKRNRAGAPENNQNAKKQSKQEEREKETIKNNQNNQNNQSFLETVAVAETVAETETENKNSGKPPFERDGKKYAFEGKVIRLTQVDFDRWRLAYPDLNLWGELMLRDDWLVKQPPDEQKRWFMSTSQYFIKQNEKRKKQNAEIGMAENEQTGGKIEKKEHDWSWV